MFFLLPSCFVLNLDCLDLHVWITYHCQMSVLVCKWERRIFSCLGVIGIETDEVIYPLIEPVENGYKSLALCTHIVHTLVCVRLDMSVSLHFYIKSSEFFAQQSDFYKKMIYSTRHGC